MNLLGKGRGLLAVFLLALLCSSCVEEENTIGLPIENPIHLKYLEYEVPVEMIWVDSVKSGLLGNIYSGRFDLEEAGNVKATPFISFRSQDYDSIEIPEGAILHDFYLELDYTTSIDNTLSSTNLLQVYQLADTLDNSRAYFIEDEIALNNLIGEKTFTFTPDSLKLSIEKGDSVDYSLKIPLDEALGADLFSKLKQDDPIFDNHTSFKSAFKGIALVPGADNSAMLGFSTVNSRIYISYHYTNDDGDIDTSTFQFRPYNYFHNITPNKINQEQLGNAFADIPCCYEGYQTTDEFLYQLFGAGINLKLDLSGFKKFADSLNMPMINTAILELSEVESTSEFSPPPSAVSFYLINQDGHRIKKSYGGIVDLYQALQSEVPNADPFRAGNPTLAAFNSTTRNYKADITFFLDHLIKNDDVPDNLLMEYPDITENETYGFYLFNRSANKLAGIKIPKGSVKVKLYYSNIE